MTAIDELFAKLNSNNQTAFMPFVTAGDPNLKFTSDLLLELDRAGCNLVELGFPYSDPIADGPVIQESYTRALSNGITVEKIFEMVTDVSGKMQMPIVSMVSFALIFRYGPEKFIADAKGAGISGAIVPDLPVDESGSFANLCQLHNFNLVQLITPTTIDERAVQIANSSTGFIYYVSVSGITGERNELPPELTRRLTWLREKTKTPVCVGFGISSPEQAAGLKPIADGVIVGSAIVKRIANANGDHDGCVNEITTFAKQMVDALV